MKQLIKLQILLMTFLTVSLGSLYPQQVQYQYDKTGNRTARTVGTASSPVNTVSSMGVTHHLTSPEEPEEDSGVWVEQVINGDTIREFRANPVELLPPGFNPEVHGSLLNPAGGEETTGSLQSAAIAPALFTVVPVTVEVDRTKDVGEIPISQAVQNGALMLSVPIELYPGRDGFQPQLSLTYSSMSGNGTAGYGWHIGGLSMITPVSSNFYYDGAAAKAETLGKDAAYMLDGMRLIRRAAGSYRTELGYTDATIDDQNNKYFFQVKYPDGRSATYGYNTHTTAQLSYPLTKMTDLSGNFMNCTYQLNNGVRNITKITYGCNGNTIGEVKFVYKSRTDTNPVYLAGSTIKQDQLLSSIQVYYKDKLLRTYTLEHLVKDFSFLSRIRCKAGTKELNPLVFYYGTGDTMPSHMTETTSFLSSYFANSASTKLNYIKYKPDNLLPEDGLVVYPQFSPYGVQSTDSKGNNVYGSTYSTTQQILVYKQLKGSTITPVKLTTGTGFQGLIPMDATGDGRDELVRINYTYASAGSNLSLTSYNTAMTATTSSYALNGYVNEGGRPSPVPRTFLAGNFTGDGKIKLVAVSGNKSPKGASLSSYMTVIDVEGKRMLHNRASVFSYDYFSDMLFTMDFDGDGRTEICHVNSTGLHIYTLINNDFVKLATYTGVTNKENAKMILLGDINGDGKTDIILTPRKDPYVITNSKNHIGGSCQDCCRSPYNLVWSTKDEEFYYCGYNPNNPNGPYDRSCYIVETTKKTYNSDAYDWKYLISTGKTFVATPIKKSFTYEGSNTFLLQDVNGDNFPDLVVKNGSQVSVYLNVNGKISTTPTLSRSIAASAYLISGVTNNSYYLNNRMGQLLAINGANVSGLVFSRNEGLERKLSGAVNSLGVISKIQYAPMSSISVYPASVTAVFPYTKVLMNEMLVNRTEVYLKGLQQENVLYKYENGMVNRQLPGFRGFSKISSTDQKRSVTVTETYNPMQDGVLTSLDTPVSSGSYVYTRTVDAQKFKKLQLQSKTEKDKLNNFTTTSTYLYDTYSNVVQENRKVGTAEEITIVNQYNNSPKIGELYIQTVTTRRGEHVWKERTHISSFQTTTRLPLKITTYVNDNQVLEVTREYTNGNLVKEQQKQFASTSLLDHTFTYNALGQLTKETNQLKQATTYDYNAEGLLEYSKNHKDKQITYTYDNWGRSIKTVYPDETTATTAYAWVTAPAGALWRHTTSMTGQSSVQTFYDALNREVRQGQMSFNGTYTYTDTQYDTRGRVSKVSLPFKTTSPTKWNTYTYDTYDRPLSVKADAPSNKKTEWSYSAGKVTVTENGIATIHTVDAAGKLLSVSDPVGTVTYQTRADGQLAATIAPGNVQTLWEYDTYGRKTKMTDPSFGQTSYVYGTNGLLQKMTDAENKETEYTYDSYHRLLTKKIPEMTITYEYNTDGLLKKEFTNRNTATTYTYDDLLRPTTVREDIPDGKWLQREMTYGSGNILTMKYTSHSGLNVTENRMYSNGHLTEQKLNNQTSYYKLTAENNLGIPSTAVTGNITRTYAYNESGMITGRSAKNGSVVLQDFGYTFDGVKGNLTTRKDNKYTKTESHTYDSMNRLLTYPGSTLTYNDNGNITKKTDAATTLSYSITGKPYATSGATGVTSAIPVRNQTVTYTSFKRPASISENTYAATFSYNERLERVKMHLTKNGTKELTRYYLGGRYEIDENSVGNVKEKLYIGGDYYSAPAVYVRENNGSWQLYYICRDYLGSITHLTNSSGSSVTQELSYDAWGRLRNPSTQTTYTPGQEPALFLGRGYTGHEHLAWFGLINMNARLYDPALGRFLSPDPYIQNPEFGQNYNRYAYCFNNPFAYTDPDGEFFLSIGAILGIATVVKGILAGAAIGAAVGAVTYSISAAVTNNWNWGNFGMAVGMGAAGGAFSGGLSAAGGAVGGFGNTLGYSMLSNTGSTMLTSAVFGNDISLTTIAGGLAGGVTGAFLPSYNALDGGAFKNALAETGFNTAKGAATGLASGLTQYALTGNKKIIGQSVVGGALSAGGYTITNNILFGTPYKPEKVMSHPDAKGSPLFRKGGLIMPFNEGVTLGRNLSVEQGNDGTWIQYHEYYHFVQQQQMGWARFYVRILSEYLSSAINNKGNWKKTYDTSGHLENDAFSWAQDMNNARKIK